MEEALDALGSLRPLDGPRTRGEVAELATRVLQEVALLHVVGHPPRRAHRCHVQATVQAPTVQALSHRSHEGGCLVQVRRSVVDTRAGPAGHGLAQAGVLRPQARHLLLERHGDRRVHPRRVHGAFQVGGLPLLAVELHPQLLAGLLEPGDLPALELQVPLLEGELLPEPLELEAGGAHLQVRRGHGRGGRDHGRGPLRGRLQGGVQLQAPVPLRGELVPQLLPALLEPGILAAHRLDVALRGGQALVQPLDGLPEGALGLGRRRGALQLLGGGARGSLGHDLHRGLQLLGLLPLAAELLPQLLRAVLEPRDLLVPLRQVAPRGGQPLLELQDLRLRLPLDLRHRLRLLEVPLQPERHGLGLLRAEPLVGHLLLPLVQLALPLPQALSELLDLSLEEVRETPARPRRCSRQGPQAAPVRSAAASPGGVVPCALGRRGFGQVAQRPPCALGRRVVRQVVQRQGRHLCGQARPAGAACRCRREGIQLTVQREALLVVVVIVVVIVRALLRDRLPVQRPAPSR
mmetsp:Transcript_17459/g.38477  ORF Transcript_17459/g.38477 Transcript_17459/m.38477 type:complete len:520 (+) Transcript_17459:392-1951(+)